MRLFFQSTISSCKNGFRTNKRFLLVALALVIPAVVFFFGETIVFEYADHYKDISSYRKYLSLYPDGEHAFEAEWKIRALEHPGTWSIGIYKGVSPDRIFPFEGTHNPILKAKDASDVDAGFLADPFLVRDSNGFFVFFELLNRTTGQGDIAYGKSVDGLSWSYGKIILDEPFHLSYPCVFRDQGDYYMIPESNAKRSVRLYKAIAFPEKWVFVKTLLSGMRFSDNTIFRYNGLWWLFSETSEHPHDNGTLRLFFAGNLEGPYTEHPRSPIMEGSPHFARPGGRVVQDGNQLIRFAQDCYPVYGYQVWAFSITRMTESEYEEKPMEKRPVVGGTGVGWNRLGMHTVSGIQMDDGGWLAVVDGLGTN